MKKLSLLMIAGLTFFSCATTLRTEPSEETDTLVVGQVYLEATDFNYYRGCTVNGKHGSGIELTFMNVSTGEERIVKSKSSEGIFYFPGEKGSKYKITKLYYKSKGSHGSWADLTSNLGRISFDISSGKVFNLGKINWIAAKRDDTYKIYQEKNYAETQNVFLEKYPESQWHQYSWEDVSF